MPEDTRDDLSAAEKHERLTAHTPTGYAANARRAEADSRDALRYPCPTCGAQPGTGCNLEDLDPCDWYPAEHETRREAARAGAGL